MSRRIEFSYRSGLAHHTQVHWLNLEQPYVPPAPADCKLLQASDALFRHDLAEPRLGRWFPARALRKPLLERSFRILRRSGNDLWLDGSQAWQGLDVACQDHPAPDSTAIARADQVANWLAMEAPHISVPPDFDETGAFARQDEDSDARFYSQPRPVAHLDGICQERLRALHAGLITPESQVLDLMASWETHLPEDMNVTGLGLNREELESNELLADFTLQDLNAHPVLPWNDASFDAVINTASFEYLVEPVAVLRETHRCLKPSGLAVVSFTNRFFPSKAIHLWTLLHPLERLTWVATLMRAAGFRHLHTWFETGLARDPRDRHSDRLAGMDPLFAIWGCKQAH
jgi:hypothetical protein